MRFLASAFFFLPFLCFSGEKIRMEEKLLGYNYYTGDSLLAFLDISGIVRENPAASKEIRRAELYADIGGVISLGGTALLAFGIGKSIVDQELAPAPILYGVGIFFGGWIPFAIVANHKIKSAVLIYNGMQPGASGRNGPITGFQYYVGFK